jgi:hypothetical protein
MEYIFYFIMVDLNSETFSLYAIKNYDSRNCIRSEFEQDLKLIKYLKRLFHKYKATGEIKERLVLNHLIVLGNVFSVRAATRMLFYKIDSRDYDVLKTFLVFLRYMPEVVEGINGKNIISSDIPLDPKIVILLRKI